MSYTIKNLREVEDLAASQGFGEVQEARFAHADLDSNQLGISLQRVKPGKRHAFAHRHQTAEEVYVVISGGGRVKLDDDIVDIRQWDVIRVPPPVMRQFEAGPDGLELLAFGAPIGEDADGEIVPGWWAD